jgi:hypothetical protein
MLAEEPMNVEVSLCIVFLSQNGTAITGIAGATGAISFGQSGNANSAVLKKSSLIYDLPNFGCEIIFWRLGGNGILQVPVSLPLAALIHRC